MFKFCHWFWLRKNVSVLLLSILSLLVCLIWNRVLSITPQAVTTLPLVSSINPSPISPFQDHFSQSTNSSPLGLSFHHESTVLACDIIGSNFGRESQPELSEFSTWSESYLGATELDREALGHEGVALARARRGVLRLLIRNSPEAALASAVPLAVRSQLPEAVQELLEERVSGRGELALFGVTPLPGQMVSESRFRTALIGRSEYRAYTYGQRSLLSTVSQVSIHGVALEGELAVSDSPLRVLEANELLEGRTIKKTCAISGKAVELTETEPNRSFEGNAVEAFGEVHLLCTPAHIPVYEANLRAAEPGGGYVADGLAGTSSIAYRPSSNWTHGPKKLLIIRVEFQDLPGVPVNYTDKQTITPTYAIAVINKPNGVRDFYQQGSYDQTSISITDPVNGQSPDVTRTFLMPQTGLYYSTTGPKGSPSLLVDDARQAATDEGYDLASYDRVCVVSSPLAFFPGSKFLFSGIGKIGGPSVYINGIFSFKVVAHELGHSYGLDHANLWQVTDGNPISGTGTSREYGDPYDVMGSGTNFQSQFSHWNKSILGWIPDPAVATVSFSGTYRVFRFDHEKAKTTNTLALKIVRDTFRDYWIGYRRATSNPGLNNGAYVVWGYNTNQHGNLLDLNTPGTNVIDAALAVGATFIDPTGQITIHPVAKGGVTPDEYLDVQITLANRPPLDRILAVTTMAGSAGMSGGANGSGTNALFKHPYGIALDKSGNVYVADSENYVVRKISTNGAVSILAGIVGIPGTANGSSAVAQFEFPFGLGVDKTGNVFVTDSTSHTIRKITPTGTVTTFAGVAGTAGSRDGTGAGALFRFPYGLAVDGVGNVYVADTSNHTIRKITPAGVVTTLAGLAGNAGFTNGTGGSTARFSSPRGVAVDAAGNVFVTESSNETVRKISPAGVVEWMAGYPGMAGDTDGYWRLGKFDAPNGVAVDNVGNVYIADQFNHTIRKMTSLGTVFTLAGQSKTPGSRDGTGNVALFNNPSGVAVDASGNLYIADSENQTVRFGRQYIKPPPLQVSSGNKEVVLTWPANLGGFSLEWATNLSSTIWHPFPTTPLIVNGGAFYTNKITVQSVFYRLKE